MTSTDKTEPQYFDLHTTGIGYLNRYRVVDTKGDGYQCVSITALSGRKDKADSIYYDAIISGTDAKALAEDYGSQINDYDTRVLVCFKIDGAKPRTFTYSKGKRAGETGIDLKCRLLRIEWIRIKKAGEDSYSEVYNSNQSNSTEGEEADPQQQAA